MRFRAVCDSATRRGAAGRVGAAVSIRCSFVRLCDSISARFAPGGAVSIRCGFVQLCDSTSDLAGLTCGFARSCANLRRSDLGGTSKMIFRWASSQVRVGFVGVRQPLGISLMARVTVGGHGGEGVARVRSPVVDCGGMAGTWGGVAAAWPGRSGRLAAFVHPLGGAAVSVWRVGADHVRAPRVHGAWLNVAGRFQHLCAAWLAASHAQPINALVESVQRRVGGGPRGSLGCSQDSPKRRSRLACPLASSFASPRPGRVGRCRAAHRVGGRCRVSGGASRLGQW